MLVISIWNTKWIGEAILPNLFSVEWGGGPNGMQYVHNSSVTYTITLCLKGRIWQMRHFKYKVMINCVQTWCYNNNWISHTVIVCLTHWLATWIINVSDSLTGNVNVSDWQRKKDTAAGHGAVGLKQLHGNVSLSRLVGHTIVVGRNQRQAR